jgi:O-antigen ligase
MIALVLLAGFILSYIDPRMRELFNIKRLIDAGFMRWASRLVFLERVMYWIAAYRVFQMFPFFGAGFGIPGFFFQKTVPVYGSQLLDINDFLLKPFFLPNAKNFWVRILSETGIIGFALYASWIVIHWRNAVELEKRTQNNLIQTMGLAGKIIVISMIIEGFSLDSFGLPYVWVALGLLSATWFISRNSDSQTIEMEQTSDL